MGHRREYLDAHAKAARPETVRGANLMSDADDCRFQHTISIGGSPVVQLVITERQMLLATDLADLISLSITGIRQLSGGSQLSSWLHDPVGELDEHRCHRCFDGNGEVGR